MNVTSLSKCVKDDLNDFLNLSADFESKRTASKTCSPNSFAIRISVHRDHADDSIIKANVSELNSRWEVTRSQRKKTYTMIMKLITITGTATTSTTYFPLRVQSNFCNV